ncbi:CRISPR-associated RAMP protein, Cmr1 family [Sulfolobus islandicus Y.G.57.14]|uniref:CRISPR-associated RAMP protein, Cmr1 family n=1 Tax=Saccharolobus islandicus (strain Y.G.57.14 / Yellowstone \|nr:type III-B CRISPR module RAMP protein Cmr1 [Sulfolobus islandicus]ACP44906.1 CRISPR-associated RAMP protein, Cmr1 family [Sulfolobus islandicus Y.G.57.14]
MEELLMSFKLKAIYPLTGGYNRHSINEFYEENVRPTEIKGLWRWWNRVLFNTVSYVKEGKLYTYDSIDRLFEDVFGSENKKSAVRLEVITDEGSDNHFELSNVELDNVIDCLKASREEKVNLDFRDNMLIIEIEDSTKIPISFKSNLDIDKIKDLVYKNKLLSFELLGFKSIKIDTKISDKEVIKEILLDLITNYLEYFNIKQEVTFTLNIYLDKSREHKQNFEDKLKFALYSLLVFILLGGIGRKTSRGFGSLSIVYAKCYDGVCSDLESYINEILKVENEKELKDKLVQLIHNIEHNVLFPDEKHRLEKVDFSNSMVYFYFTLGSFLEHTLFVNEADPNKVKCILDTVSEAVIKEGKCVQLIQNYLAFLVLFCGNRANEKRVIDSTQCIDDYLKSLVCNSFDFASWFVKYSRIFNDKKRRPSALRFKILTMNNGKTFLLTYLLIPSYIEYITNNPVKVNYNKICKDLKTLADCVSKNVKSRQSNIR